MRDLLQEGLKVATIAHNDLEETSQIERRDLHASTEVGIKGVMSREPQGLDNGENLREGRNMLLTRTLPYPPSHDREKEREEEMEKDKGMETHGVAGVELCASAVEEVEPLGRNALFLHLQFAKCLVELDCVLVVAENPPGLPEAGIVAVVRADEEELEGVLWLNLEFQDAVFEEIEAAARGEGKQQAGLEDGESCKRKARIEKERKKETQTAREGGG